MIINEYGNSIIDIQQSNITKKADASNKVLSLQVKTINRTVEHQLNFENLTSISILSQIKVNIRTVPIT